MRCRYFLQLSLLWASHLISNAQQDGALEPFVVDAEELRTWESDPGYTGQSLDRETLNQQPGSTVSDRLLGRGGFRLFRRQSSLAAHPTTQGAALRVAGPNGASRTNVYLDGVPLNDPFGGWVPWTAINTQEIARTEIVQPSGIDPWGNVSLGGSAWLESRRTEPFWSFESAFGNVVNHQLANAFLLASKDGATRIYGSWSSLQTGGYHIIRPDQRGPIDQKATVEADAVMLGIARDFGGAWSLSGDLRYHEEKRGNGTELAVNAQDSWQARVGLTKERSGDSWEGRLTGYWQARDFSSVFTRVSALRDEERPVLDQFDVPAWAAGLTWRSNHWLGDAHEFAITLDSRLSEGETNERFRNLGNGFTRLRKAGGQRTELGAAMEHTWHATPEVALKSSVRIDHARDHAGNERTWNLEDGARLTDNAFASAKDWQVNGRLALEWNPSDAWNLHWSGFTGTRRPTLNELYRPFRVGNDITLANAQLESERLWGSTLGIEWKPDEAWALRLEGFWHRLDDGIANVTLTEGGGGVVQPWGFIPEGGSGRQRRNVDEVAILGFESALTWQSNDGWMLEAGYLLTDSDVRHSRDQPELEGRTLAQMPTHQAYASMGYDGGGSFYGRLEGRWTGAVFDDDLNRRELSSYVMINAQLGWRFTDEVSCFLSLENLLDEEIEVSQSGAGLIGIGAPRLIQLGLRLDF